MQTARRFALATLGLAAAATIAGFAIQPWMRFDLLWIDPSFGLARIPVGAAAVLLIAAVAALVLALPVAWLSSLLWRIPRGSWARCLLAGALATAIGLGLFLMVSFPLRGQEIALYAVGGLVAFSVWFRVWWRACPFQRSCSQGMSGGSQTAG